VLNFGGRRPCERSAADPTSLVGAIRILKRRVAIKCGPHWSPVLSTLHTNMLRPHSRLMTMASRLLVATSVTLILCPAPGSQVCQMQGRPKLLRKHVGAGFTHRRRKEFSL